MFSENSLTLIIGTVNAMFLLIVHYELLKTFLFKIRQLPYLNGNVNTEFVKIETDLLYTLKIIRTMLMSKNSSIFVTFKKQNMAISKSFFSKQFSQEKLMVF